MKGENENLVVSDQSAFQIHWFDSVRREKRFLNDRVYLRMKRLMDVGIIFSTAPAWLLLLAFSGLLVKLESPRDPVIYTQYRTGKNGCRFRMYKFRTMVPNAEALKKELSHLNVNIRATPSSD